MEVVVKIKIWVVDLRVTSNMMINALNNCSPKLEKNDCGA